MGLVRVPVRAPPVGGAPDMPGVPLALEEVPQVAAGVRTATLARGRERRVRVPVRVPVQVPVPALVPGTALGPQPVLVSRTGCRTM